jgi:hypothetical protein
VLVLPVFCAGGRNLPLNEPDLARFCRTVEREAVTHAMAMRTLPPA